MWYIIDNLTSLDIDFYFIYFLSKYLLYHIYDAISLSGKTLYIT